MLCPLPGQLKALKSSSSLDPFGYVVLRVSQVSLSPQLFLLGCVGQTSTFVDRLGKADPHLRCPVSAWLFCSLLG